MPESFRPSHLLTFLQYRPKIYFQTFKPISRIFVTFLRIAYVIRYPERCEMGISKVRFFCDNDIRGFGWLSLVHVSTGPEFRLSVQISDLEDLIRIPQSSACI